MSILRRIKDARDVALGKRKVASDIADPLNLRGGSTGIEFRYGQPIQIADLIAITERDPVAHRIVYNVANDIWDNWFSVDNPDTEKKDAGLNRRVQRTLTQLDAKNKFIQASIFEREFGWSILAVGHRDSGKSLAEPLEDPRGIGQLHPYPPTSITSIDEDKSSERYGLPLTYKVNMGSGTPTPIHYTRVIHFATRLHLHPYKGISALAPVFDDITVLENVKWGMGQAMVRIGGGLPDITILGAEDDDIDKFHSSGRFKDLSARTSFVHSEKQTLEFKGAAGVALNPQWYYLPILENISAGTGIPVMILRGAQIGAVTGSETNLQEYFKLISANQTRYEPCVRQLLDMLIEAGEVHNVPRDYAVVWPSGFEPTDKDRAATDLMVEQAQQIRLNYMTKDEVRANSGVELKALTEEQRTELAAKPAQQTVAPLGAPSQPRQMDAEDEETRLLRRLEIQGRIDLLKRIGMDLNEPE